MKSTNEVSNWVLLYKICGYYRAGFVMVIKMYTLSLDLLFCNFNMININEDVIRPVRRGVRVRVRACVCDRVWVWVCLCMCVCGWVCGYGYFKHRPIQCYMVKSRSPSDSAVVTVSSVLHSFLQGYTLFR